MAKKPKSLPIANQIRRLRFEHGEMTQSELAEKIGMTRQTVAAIEAANASRGRQRKYSAAPVFPCAAQRKTRNPAPNPAYLGGGARRSSERIQTLKKKHR